MKIGNKTDIPNWLVRGIIYHCQVPKSVLAKTIFMIVNNGRSDIQGSATRDGRSVIVRIAPTDFNELFWLPVNWKEMDYIEIYNRLELLIYCMAHELRHVWQHRQIDRSQYYPKARGKYSEVDAECWALNRVRLWRRTISIVGRSVKVNIVCEKCHREALVRPDHKQCYQCFTTKEITCPKCGKKVMVYYKHSMCSDCFYVYVAMDRYVPPRSAPDRSKRIPENPYDGMGFYECNKKINDDK